MVPIWADTYDRKLTDIFAVETEIARSIADALRAKLTGTEEQALVVKPTNNPEAYDAYLRGLAAEGQQLHSVYASSDAAAFYEQAVTRFPIRFRERHFSHTSRVLRTRLDQRVCVQG